MALGTLLVGALIGATVFGKKETTYNNVYIIEQDPYKAKVQFFDVYRKIDEAMAHTVNRSYGGITMYINGYKRMLKDVDDACEYRVRREFLGRVIALRHYRNALAHSDMDWADIPNPRQSLYGVLRELCDVVNTNQRSIRQICLY